jgi:2-keto-4-pentenoate hydratase/2-oxohepta-3-ene-1,7-dioic acid hydratase in catechol pathway
MRIRIVKLARIMVDGRPRTARVVPGGYVVESAEVGEREVSTEEVRLLAPAVPTKIIAVGWNFPAHVAEMIDRMPERTLPNLLDEPVLFLKPPSALVGHLEAVVYPRQATRVEYEGELVAVIGREARRVAPDEARDVVAGWTCGNDVTERNLQRRDKQWWRAKGFDTFAPVGPYLETEPPDPEAWIRTYRNGELVQQGRVGDMLRDPFVIISLISEAMTLVPGDMVMLGTPPGVGEVRPGYVVEVDIEGVGRLRNPVVAED